MQGARDFGGMRWSQTANYGVVPNDALPNAFLAHAYDLPDPWMTNTSCSDWECCEVDLRGKPLRRKRPELSAALCNKRTRSLGGPEVCAPYCAALVDTPPGLLGSLHPRVKKPIGVRLAQAAYAQVYGGSNAVTGPTIAGCTLNKATRRLVIGFNKTLPHRAAHLAEEAPPSFQVLTEPEAWCLQPMQRCPSQRDEQKEDVSCPWESREWWCPIELKGGGHYRTSQTVDPHGGLSGGSLASSRLDRPTSTAYRGGMTCTRVDGITSPLALSTSVPQQLSSTFPRYQPARACMRYGTHGGRVQRRLAASRSVATAALDTMLWLA